MDIMQSGSDFHQFCDNLMVRNKTVPHYTCRQGCSEKNYLREKKLEGVEHERISHIA